MDPIRMYARASFLGTIAYRLVLAYIEAKVEMFLLSLVDCLPNDNAANPWIANACPAGGFHIANRALDRDMHLFNEMKHHENG